LSTCGKTNSTDLATKEAQIPKFVVFHQQSHFLGCWTRLPIFYAFAKDCSLSCERNTFLFCEADGQLWKECQRYRVKNLMALVSFVLHLCSVRNQNSTENSAKATHPETARNGAKGERRLPGSMKGLQDVLRTTPPSRLTSHLSVRSIAILLPHCPTLWARLDPTSCENMDSQCHDAKKGSSS